MELQFLLESSVTFDIISVTFAKMDSTFTDFHLLNFSTYEEYLDSYVTSEDIRNLRSTRSTRLIAELGYNSTSEVLRKEDFEARKQYAKELLNPSRKSHELFGADHDVNDPVMSELAARERSNRVGILNTIIFIRQMTKRGHEVSGYIDFEWSLRMARMKAEDAVDWEMVFKGKKRLWPTTRDLGYYNWKTGVSYSNNTENYKVIADPNRGLTFLNRHDRKVICPDPSLVSAGVNTTKIVILDSPRYEHCVIYDHVLRKMI